MPRFEYKLVPAPERATKRKGLKGVAGFAATLEDLMNALGREGWHYLRADTLPQVERSGLTSRTTTYRNMLVFQRALPDDPPPPPRKLAGATRATEPAKPTALDAGEDTEEGEPALANLFADHDSPPALHEDPQKPDGTS